MGVPDVEERCVLKERGAGARCGWLAVLSVGADLGAEGARGRGSAGTAAELCCDARSRYAPTDRSCARCVARNLPRHVGDATMGD